MSKMTDRFFLLHHMTSFFSVLIFSYTNLSFGGKESNSLSRIDEIASDVGFYCLNFPLT